MLEISLDRQPDIRFQDGALRHALGVKSFQALRANRAHPELADGFGWTYNHAPMLCWYHGKYYIEYLSNPVSEHETPGHTLLMSSKDGVNWSFPIVAFAPIEARLDCYRGPRGEQMPESVLTVPHQRMGFYCATNDCMLLLSFYGIVHDRRLCSPCDGWGVGRAARRIFPDGSLGDIYFVIYNEVAGYNRENMTAYPYFEDSGDDEMIFACRELLSNRPVMNQMYEEQRHDKALFPRPLGKAASFYTAKDGSIVTVFKRGLSMRSLGGGQSFGDMVENPTLKTSTGKVWGQRTSDGNYALMYNPTPDGQHRWPIAIVSGEDGYHFKDMRAVTGYMSPQRYGGLDKNPGPQYMRGICQGNPLPEDGDIHLVYSNNKEDIWISHLPPQLDFEAEAEIDERFEGEEFLPLWSVYSPIWSPVRMTGEAMELKDADPCDRALVERGIRPSQSGETRLKMRLESVFKGSEIVIELWDEKRAAPIQLLIDSAYALTVRAGGHLKRLFSVPKNEIFELKIDFDCARSRFELSCGEFKSAFDMSAACETIERVSVATKALWRVPYSDLNTDGKLGSGERDLKNVSEKTEETRLEILSFGFKRREI